MPHINAVSSLGWANYTLYEALPKIKKLGFKKVEIASFCSYAFHFNFGSPTPDELKKMGDDMGFEFIYLNYSPDRYFAWEKGFEEKFYFDCEKKLKQLPKVGIKKMTLITPERNERQDIDLQFDRMIALYDDVGEMAKRYGVMMVLEVPHLYTIINRPEHVYKVLERIKSDNIGVLADSSHWGIIKYDADEFFSAVGERLAHIHLRDSTGPDTNDRKQMLELTPGKGTTDFIKFGSALDKAGYSGDISIEFEYRDMTLDDIDREYEEGFSHLKKCGWTFPKEVRIK